MLYYTLYQKLYIFQHVYVHITVSSRNSKNTGAFSSWISVSPQPNKNWDNIRDMNFQKDKTEVMNPDVKK